MQKFLPVLAKYFFAILIFSPVLVQAQLNGSYVIQGKITDDHGNALPGASVQIKGTSLGAQTDTGGQFEVTSNTKFPLKLVIRLIGYQPQEFEVKSSSSKVAIQLYTQSLLVNEVVVSASRQQEKTAPLACSHRKTGHTGVEGNTFFYLL